MYKEPPEDIAEIDPKTLEHFAKYNLTKGAFQIVLVTTELADLADAMSDFDDEECDYDIETSKVLKSRRKLEAMYAENPDHSEYYLSQHFFKRSMPCTLV